MKWNKYNCPKKRVKHQTMYSQEYINERKNEMYALIAKAKDDNERDAIIKAYHVTINP